MSRGKKILSLIVDEKSANTANVDNLGEGKSTVYDDLEELGDGDPWTHYKEWNEIRMKKSRSNLGVIVEEVIENSESPVLHELKPIEPNEMNSKQNSERNLPEAVVPSGSGEMNLEEDFLDLVHIETEDEMSLQKLLYSENEKENEKSDNVQIMDKPAKCNQTGHDRAENEEVLENSGKSSEDEPFENSSTSWKPDGEDNYSDASISIESPKISGEIPTPTTITQNNNIPQENVQAGEAEDVIRLSQSERPTPKTNQLYSRLSDLTQPNIPRTDGNLVEHSRRKSRVWDKRDRCVYCATDVTNFSRHLLRKHSDEASVKKIIEQPKRDPQRKLMIEHLRKEGNFSILGEKITRPVQRPASQQFLNSETENPVLPSDYLPCKYCKGMYKKKSLRRHALKCHFNDEGNKKQNYSSEGQTMLAFTETRQEFMKTLRLRTEVFSNMHADRISLNGKSDPVICQYAEDYLRKHKRPHIRNAVSNKVRELGRLLIPLQDIFKINSMIEVLKPEHFDKVVSASRIISGYDETTRSFRAPSLALHLKTILLAVCSAAKTLLLKKNPVLSVENHEIALKNLKGFRELVDANWKFEMGSLALKDLNEKHATNPQKLPVTQDIILFRNYTHKVADTCMESLKSNQNDRKSFKELTEAALALTIILNRKRIGDVQYTKVDSYTNNLISNNQEECLNVLTDTERELSKHFKRIITVGKGSRSVPILFSKHEQACIDTLLSVRKVTSFVPKENPFLFALPGSSSRWVDGSAVLRKYAVNCGAKNPGTLTSSRLRKQIATVLQILNLNDTEMEQVATFMGHTRKTHEEFYRLPQEVYQTAKIAKLLLMMQKGVGSENQGKTLDEIDVELESWNGNAVVNESDSDESQPENLNNLGAAEESGEQRKDSSESQAGAGTSGIKKARGNKPENVELDAESIEQQSESCSESEEETRPKKKKAKTEKNKSRGRWNAKQKSIMLKYFRKHIKDKISPKKEECLKLREDHLALFKDKNWVQIKVFVYNTFRMQKE